MNSRGHLEYCMPQLEREESTTGQSLDLPSQLQKNFGFLDSIDMQREKGTIEANDEMLLSQSFAMV